MDLLKRLGFTSPSWADLATVLIGVLVLASLTGAAWALWERRQRDPWLRLLEQARVRLAERGLPGTAQMPPRTLARQLLQHFGDTDNNRRVSEWLLRLEAQRYSRESPLTLATLRRDLQQLVWPRTGNP